MPQNTDLCTQLEHSHVISNAFRDGRGKSFVVSFDNVTFRFVMSDADTSSSGIVP